LIIAYFIGGPADLTKRALPGKQPPHEYYFARLGPFVAFTLAEENGPHSVAKCVSPPRDSYRLTYGSRTEGVFIYEYDRNRST
jgi:hypothetical protein